MESKKKITRGKTLLTQKKYHVCQHR